jgi:hypothetical protein
MDREQLLYGSRRIRLCKHVKGMYNILCTSLTHIIFSERKSRDIATTKVHLESNYWHTYSVFVCCPISGNTKAVFETNDTEKGYKA